MKTRLSFCTIVIWKPFSNDVSLAFFFTNEMHSTNLTENVIHQLQEDLVHIEVILGTGFAETHPTYPRGKLQIPQRGRSFRSSEQTQNERQQ